MNILLLAILYISFISLGLADQVLGVAWPDIRRDFGLPISYAGILIIIMSIATTVSSFLSGYLIRKFALANILIVSVAANTLALIMCGLSSSWWMLILASIPYGLSAGAVDSVLNDYVSKNLNSRHMNWLHGFWGLGATLGPAIMTLSISISNSWRIGYIVIGVISSSLFFLFVFTRKIWKNTSDTNPKKEKIKFNLLTPAHFISVMFFFIYTSLEGAVGVWFYSILVEDRLVSKEFAGMLIVLFWASLTVGRFINGWLATKINCAKAIKASLFCALIGIVLLSFDNTIITVVAIVTTGLSLSAIYPCMMFETSSRFDPETASVLTGYQVGFACLGYALVIPFIGFILNYAGLNSLIPILAIMCLSLICLDIALRKVLKNN